MTEQKIIIRKAIEADYPAVNHLYCLSYGLYHQNIPGSYKEIGQQVISRGDFLNILEDEEAFMIVAEVEGKIVGHLYAMIDDDEDGKITKGYHRIDVAEISIEPEYARKGIGTKLMENVENWAKEKNIVDLSTLVYDFNKEAIDFYKSNGYKPYSIRMEKKITKE